MKITLFTNFPLPKANGNEDYFILLVLTIHDSRFLFLYKNRIITAFKAKIFFLVLRRFFDRKSGWF